MNTPTHSIENKDPIDWYARYSAADRVIMVIHLMIDHCYQDDKDPEADHVVERLFLFLKDILPADHLPHPLSEYMEWAEAPDPEERDLQALPQERLILSMMASLWNIFTSLPEQDPEALQLFRHHINSAEALIGLRMARRSHPSLWNTPS